MCRSAYKEPLQQNTGMKSLLISPGLGQLCTDGFIDTIYKTYSPDFAKCWYNNVSAVASWADAIPGNATGLLVNSTSDNEPGLSVASRWILITLFGLCVLGSIVSCVCISKRVSHWGQDGDKESEMKLINRSSNDDSPRIQETTVHRFI